MVNYLFAYHGGGMAETEQEQKQVMADWGKWYEELGAAIVDGGNPVGRTMMIATDGSTTEGGGADPVTGYTVISADDMDAAVEMAKGCPHLKSGGTVEVGETFDVMG
jgi:hypothetical protein